jgi:cytoskeletal protein CcmA (bactofilin family)
MAVSKVGSTATMYWLWAKIEGEINVGTVIIQGEVVGNINATVKVEVHHPGKVIGDISTPSIMIDDGAIFDGNCKMKEVKKVEKKGEKEIGLFSRKKEAEAQEEEEKKVERVASDSVL